MANIFFLFQPGAPVSATSLCIVFILAGISLFLHDSVFLFLFFPPQPSIAFPTVHKSLACVQIPPVPSGKIGEGPLLRFFLRGEGSLHRQEGDGILTQAIHHKTLFSFIFSFVLTFIIARFGGTAGFSLNKFSQVSRFSLKSNEIA